MANLITPDFKIIFLDFCIHRVICIQIARHTALRPRLACVGVKVFGAIRGQGSTRSHSCCSIDMSCGSADVPSWPWHWTLACPESAAASMGTVTDE